MDTVTAPVSGKSRRGFASMTPEQRSRIASMGGKRAHEMGTAHQFNSEEAANAGKKGGKLLAEKKGLSYMAEIGRRGGSARKIKVTTATQTPAAAPAVTE